MGTIQKSLASALLIGGTLGLGSNAYAAACPEGVNLTSNTNYVQFGDALSYSLPILGINVQSSPGQINDCIVITSGAGGVLDNGSTSTIDNAYDNTQGSQNPYFQTGDPVNLPDPGGAGQFNGDSATTWDIRVSELEAFLNGATPMIYFNHNQTNSGGAVDQDLFIWGQIILRNDAGQVLAVFDLQAVPNGLPPTNDLAFNFGVPSGDPGTFTDTTAQGFANPVATSLYVRATGQVCLAAPGIPGVSPIVPCTTPGAVAFNENLGANQVANAIVIPELNAFLAQPNFGGATVLQIDLRMGCKEAEASDAYLPASSQYVNPTGNCPLGSVTNNGFEQAFIVASPTTFQTPEPQALLLVALGLLVAAGVSRGVRKS
jgi:hypothetical protein